ncbi:MAG TPA: formate dehydrogenase subunit alpha [Candidatus Tectomicrobia bacterium]|jgi:formate dehydrogenase alpha subunit
MTTLTIDGQTLHVTPGTTVLAAALAHGIDIPHLCSHPELAPSGGCRLCLVEIEGRPTPQPGCGVQCVEGMVVHTQSDQLGQLRWDIIDLFVSDHPLRCAVCDKNGACDLQRYAYQYGVGETSYEFERSRTLFQDDNPFFVRDHQYCILCAKCVRVCDEVVGVNAIDLVGRGFTSHVATPFDGPMLNSSCVFCGNCVQVCPTAALLPVSRLGKGREWELERQRTICGYCGVGCGIEYARKDGAILYAQGYPEAPVNGEFLCVKGRFGWDFATHPDRLTQPLVRRELLENGAQQTEDTGRPSNLHQQSDFVPVSWETALDMVATRLAEVVQAHGPDAVAGLASARCTNEENYLFQKLMRTSLGTNNVDHCARLCHASSVTGLGMAFGSGAMTNPIRDVRHADCILITGSNTAESHPVISYEVVRAVKQGAHLIIIDPRRVPMVDHATLFLQPTPGTDIFIFLAMAHIILREGWADTAFINTRTEGFEAFAHSVEQYTPEVAALASGVPAEHIEQAARHYALGERANGSVQMARGCSTMLYAMGITQRHNGTDMVLTLANLAMLCGQLGKPSTGVNPLRGQSNVQGACDMGALPNVLPGYQPVSDATRRQAVAQAWGRADLPSTPGLTVVEMMHAAVAGKIRAMYVMGENPMLSDPNITQVEAALHALDFLVVQDIFLSETAQLAHVVLPAASSLEKDGTFTNTERRVQLLAPVLPPPGEAHPDWQILCAMGAQLDARLDQQRWTEDGSGRGWEYPSTAAIMDEVARVTPIYGGMRHERLAGSGLVWPCPTADHPGTPILHTDTFTRGRGAFHAVAAQLPAEQPDAAFPLILTTGRILYHYHTGTMTRRSAGLTWRESRGYAEINVQDAAAAGIRDGGPVLITSRRGQVRTQARVGQRVPPGTVFLSFHWKEAPTNLLTQDFALDPLAKIPEYKVCAVCLERPRSGAHGKALTEAAPLPAGREG